VALGHIHAPQPVPGARVPAQYAGSLLQLDFGEAGEVKRVVVVDTSPEAPASIRSVPVTGGRPLIRVEGTWEEIAQRDDLDDAFLDLVVRTEGPDPGLMDAARERFPNVVKVKAEYERSRDTRPSTAGRPLDDLYADYHREVHGEAAADDLMALFREISIEVADASD
jgi:exonuclease SbcD